MRSRKALAKSAMECEDRARIILYGERVLTAEPANDDLQLIDRVTRALLETDDSGSAKKALAYAKRYEREVEAMRSRAGPGPSEPRRSGRKKWTRARRAHSCFRPERQAMLGDWRMRRNWRVKAWEMYPGAEGAREAARWLAKLGRDTEAIEFYADCVHDGRWRAPPTRTVLRTASGWASCSRSGTGRKRGWAM